MFRKILTALLVFICSLTLAFSQGPVTDFSTGFLVMGGVRYDDVRMCVGSEAGVKGGPIADLMFSSRYLVRENQIASFNLPVMRPLLFGIAFKMLQFEPEFTYEFHAQLGGRDFFAGPGVGFSLNYGPDYTSDTENRGTEFFSLGPILSMYAGTEFGHDNYLSLKGFYSPLFSFGGGPDGMVLGVAAGFSKYF